MPRDGERSSLAAHRKAAREEHAVGHEVRTWRCKCEGGQERNVGGLGLKGLEKINRET